MVRFKTLSRDEAKRIISAFDNYDDVEFDDLGSIMILFPNMMNHL